MKRLVILAILLLPLVCNAAPSSISVSGTVSHDQSITITGTGFGSKSQAAPVVWDNLEDGTCNTTATIGTWTSVNDLAISETYLRHSNSSYSAAADLAGVTTEAYFTGGSDAQYWYVSYWYYVPSGFDWGGGNIKMYRHWSTGSDTSNWYFLPRPSSASGHGMLAWDDMPLTSTYYSGTCPPDAGTGWYPVTSEYSCVDEVFGHACNCSDWLPKGIEWRSFDTDMPAGTWHRLEFEFKDSTLDTADGSLKIWADGRLIIEKTTLTTRTTEHQSYKRPKEVGWYNSNTGDADGVFTIDDAYIDDAWCRVELGDNATYANCTHREIQIPSAWSDTSITVTVNQGSFSAEDTVYLFVVDSDGATGVSGALTIGSGSSPAVSGSGVSGSGVSNSGGG